MNSDSERVDEFIDRFQQEPQTAAHLVEVKRYYRKIKTLLISSFSALYLMVFTAVASGINIESGIFPTLLTILTVVLLLIGLILVILYLDIYRHELSNDELALHEFSQAILEFRKDPPDHQKWKEHLTNSRSLIKHHDARIFSKYMADQVCSYIDRVEETDADNPTKANFEDFIRANLLDLVEERNTEYNWGDIYDPSQTKSSSFRSVFTQALRNVVGRSRIKNWFPVLGVLLIGFSIFFTYDEQVGSLFTIAMLSVISIVRSESE